MSKSLNDREKAFAKEYIRNGANARKAALSAGYAEATAEYASNWLNPKKPRTYKPQLRDFIDQLIEEAESEKTATPKEIMEYFSALGRGELVDTFVANDGTVLSVPASIRDRTKGFELLGRIFGVFNDRLNISEPVPVVLTGADDLADFEG